MHYGDDKTIHQSGYVDVELGPNGKVVAVWFRCAVVPFKETRVGRERADEMVHMYKEENVSRVEAIDFADEPSEEDSDTDTLEETATTKTAQDFRKRLRSLVSLQPDPPPDSDSDPVKHYAHGDKVTLSGKPADPNYDGGAPQPIDPVTGMHKDYWVLSPEERAKGFVRPVRRTYKHVGDRPKFPLRDLTSEEQIRYAGCNYTKFEQYLEADGSSVSGRFWTEARLNSGCGTLTTMGDAIAETYARNPEFYGATFCGQCRDHYPVGEKGEFEWLDGSKVGS